MTLNNISLILKARGDYESALDFLQQSLQISLQIGDAAGLCATLFNIGHIHLQNGQQQEALIDLTKVKSCKAVNINRTAAENRKIIDRLALAFTTGEQAEKERQLEFYNAQEYPSLTEELGLLDKWQKLVSEQLKTASPVG